MTFSVIIILMSILLFVVVIAVIVYRRVPRKLKVDQFVEEWKKLQGHCKDKAMWSQALAEADRLLDKALKKRKFKGKSMGERMVSAQRSINNNDQLWFAHNLAKKVIADPTTKLKEADVKVALIGFRQALKDIGALATPSTDQASTTSPEQGKKEAARV